MKLNDLKQYYIIIKDNAFDSTIYVCRHKKTLKLEYFIKQDNFFIPAWEEIKEKLDCVYKNKYTGIVFYQISKKVANLVDIKEFDRNIKDFYEEIISNVDDNLLRLKIRAMENSLKFSSLEEYEKKQGIEIKNILGADGAYNIKNHEIIIFEKNFSSCNTSYFYEVQYHEFLHALSRQNEKEDGFESFYNDEMLFIALNEYYTEFLTQKKFKKPIYYFTCDIFSSIFEGSESDFINLYFNGKTNQLLFNLSRKYYGNSSLNKILNIFLKCDTLLRLHRYIDNQKDKTEIEKYKNKLKVLYFQVYIDVIELKIKKCLLKNIPISQKNLKIETTEAYFSSIGVDEYELPYKAILKNIKSAVKSGKRIQKEWKGQRISVDNLDDIQKNKKENKKNIIEYYFE